MKVLSKGSSYIYVLKLNNVFVFHIPGDYSEGFLNSAAPQPKKIGLEELL